MKFTLTDDGRQLIEIRNIESRVVTDDPKAATVFRNVLLNSLCEGKIKPRNEFGFKIDLLAHFKVSEDAVEELTEITVREINRPRSISDLSKDVDPAKISRQSKERLQRDAKTNLKEAVLIGYVAKDDVIKMLSEHGIACEWVSSESNSLTRLPTNRLGIVINDTKKRRYALDDAIDKAISEHGFVANSIWIALITWARSARSPFRDLIGFTDEGIQYIGKKYQATDEYDILTRKQLSERIRKRKRAAEKRHPNPL